MQEGLGGQRSVPLVFWSFLLSPFLPPLFYSKSYRPLSKIHTQQRTEVTTVNSRGSFHILRSPSPRVCHVPGLFGLSFFLLSSILHAPPPSPFSYQTKWALKGAHTHTHTHTNTHTYTKAQVAKFLLEFSQQNQTKHKTAQKKGEGLLGAGGGGGGGGGGEKRREEREVIFSGFLRLCRVYF